MHIRFRHLIFSLFYRRFSDFNWSCFLLSHAPSCFVRLSWFISSCQIFEIHTLVNYCHLSSSGCMMTILISFHDNQVRLCMVKAMLKRDTRLFLQYVNILNGISIMMPRMKRVPQSLFDRSQVTGWKTKVLSLYQRPLD